MSVCVWLQADFYSCALIHKTLTTHFANFAIIYSINSRFIRLFRAYKRECMDYLGNIKDHIYVI